MSVDNSVKTLLKYEATGEYLFHGSPQLFEKIVPYLSYNWNRETGERYEDGNLSVKATEIVKIAIFRAFTHSSQFFSSSDKYFGTSFGLTPEGGIRLEVTPDTLEELKRGKIGYVYILSKRGFSKYRSIEWRIKDTVTPLKTIKVDSRDFDLPIRIMKEFT